MIAGSAPALRSQSCRYRRIRPRVSGRASPGRSAWSAAATCLDSTPAWRRARSRPTGSARRRPSARSRGSDAAPGPGGSSSRRASKGGRFTKTRISGPRSERLRAAGASCGMAGRTAPKDRRASRYWKAGSWPFRRQAVTSVATSWGVSGSCSAGTASARRAAARAAPESRAAATGCGARLPGSSEATGTWATGTRSAACRAAGPAIAAGRGTNPPVRYWPPSGPMPSLTGRTRSRVICGRPLSTASRSSAMASK